MDKRIPVTVLNGYVGDGKTELLNSKLNAAQRKNGYGAVRFPGSIARILRKNKPEEGDLEHAC